MRELDEILENVREIETESCCGLQTHPYSIAKAKEAIIKLFMECVPEERILNKGFNHETIITNGWNFCRTEMLRRIEEVGK